MEEWGHRVLITFAESAAGEGAGFGQAVDAQHLPPFGLSPLFSGRSMLRVEGVVVTAGLRGAVHRQQWPLAVVNCDLQALHVLLQEDGDPTGPVLHGKRGMPSHQKFQGYKWYIRESNLSRQCGFIADTV